MTDETTATPAENGAVTRASANPLAYALSALQEQTALFRDDETTLDELMRVVLVKREEVLAAESELKQAQETAYNAEQTLVSAMLDQGLRSFRATNGQLVNILEQTWPHVAKEFEEQKHEWLRQIGLGALIKMREAVNAQTFAAEIRKRIEAGEELPEWIKISKEKKISIGKEKKS